jgi:hypothetical protein
MGFVPFGLVIFELLESVNGRDVLVFLCDEPPEDGNLLKHVWGPLIYIIYVLYLVHLLVVMKVVGI